MNRFLQLTFSLFFLAFIANASEPLVRTLDVRGLQVGAVTTLVFDGDGFGKSPKLLLPFNVTPVLKTGSTEKKASFDITLPPDIVPGFYQCSLLAEGGVSLPVLLGIDHLVQKPFAVSIDQPLPIAMHGTISGSQILETKFQGTKGQQLMVEVEAQKLGSKLQPVLHLYNSKKLQVAWSWPVPHLFGDTRLEITLPEDDTYTIALHDLEYAAGAPGLFRMKVGKWEFFDQVIPTVVAEGKVKAVELMGNMPVAKLNMPTTKGAGSVVLPWPTQGKWSGMRPFVQSGSSQEYVETQAPPMQELKGLPLFVHGKLLQPNEEDRYLLACSPKSKLRFDVFAERIGSAVDAGLVLRNDKGVEIARAEDRPGSSDPLLEFTVPDAITSIQVCVIDSQGRGGPKANYRLGIEDISTPETSAIINLITPIQRFSLGTNSNMVFPVWAIRNGYAGKIDVQFSQLPKGVKIEGNVIPPEGDGALITVKTNTEATLPIVTTLIGKNDKGISSEVGVLNHPLQRLQPWMASEIAVAPVSEKAPSLSIAWNNLPKNIAFVPGMKMNLPVKVIREDLASVVRLTLITSQNAPKVNNQPDPKVAVKAEKAVEVAAKASDATVSVLVPVGPFPVSVYDITLQAELLSANKQVVLATAYAPVLRLPLRIPLVVSIDKPGKLEALFDAKKGSAFLFKGKVERSDGLVGDVTLVATGLPAGAKFEPALVKADKNEFDGKIILPATLMPNEYKGIKLTASGVPDIKAPTIKVNSKDVELVLVLKPAPK